jgi:hypothetical protein
MRKRTWVILAIVVFFGVLITYSHYGIYHYEVGATRFSVGFGCRVIRFPPELQWVWTFVITCPGRDMIRIWPLPVVNPWFEDRGSGEWL